MKHCNVNRWKNRSRRGFTLMELLIVVGIIAILAGTTIVSVTTLIPTLRQKELDNSAREIFLAAQNRLTMMEATGELDEMVKNKSSYGTIAWTDSSVTGQYLTRAQILDANTNNQTTVFNANTLVVGEFSGDYIVEFNLDTAQVISVFCSNESLANFEDGGNTGYLAVSGLRGIQNWGAKDSSVRKKTARENGQPQIGYYDYQMNGGSLASGNNEFSDVTVTVVNEEELYLFVKFADGCVPVNTEENPIVLSLGGNTFKFSDDGFKGRICKDTDTKYRILLDKAGTDFTWDNLVAIDSNELVKAVITATTTGGETCYGESAEFSGLYAGFDDNGAAKIACVRHLMNLQNADDNITGAVQTKDIDFAGEKVLKWGSTEGDNASFISDSNYWYKYVSYLPAALDGITYDGQEKLLKNFNIIPRFDTADADYESGRAGIFSAAAGCTLQNIRIVNATVGPYTHKVNEVDQAEYAAEAGALVGYAEGGTIQNCYCYLEGTGSFGVIKGGVYAGGLVGHAKGTTVTCSVAAMWEINACEESSYAGGFAGWLEGGSVRSSYADSAYVRAQYVTDAYVGAKYVGGFAGKVSGGAAVNGCYAVTEVLAAKIKAGSEDPVNGIAAGFVAVRDSNVTLTNNYAMIGSVATDDCAGDKLYSFAPGTTNTENKNYYITSGFTANDADYAVEITLDDLAGLAGDGKPYASSSLANSHPYTTSGEGDYAYLVAEETNVFPGVLVKDAEGNGIPHYGNWPNWDDGNGDGTTLVKVHVNSGSLQAGESDWKKCYATALEGRLWLYQTANAELFADELTDDEKNLVETGSGDVNGRVELINQDSSKGEYSANGEVSGVYHVLLWMDEKNYIDLGTVDTSPAPAAEGEEPPAVEPLDVYFYTFTSAITVDDNNWAAGAPEVKCSVIYDARTFDEVDQYQKHTDFTAHTFLVLKDAKATLKVDDTNAQYTNSSNVVFNLVQNRGERISDQYTMAQREELNYAYYTVTYVPGTGHTMVGSANRLYRANDTVQVATVNKPEQLKYWQCGDDIYVPYGYYRSGNTYPSTFVITKKMTLTADWWGSDEVNITLHVNCNLSEVTDNGFWNGSATKTLSNAKLDKYRKTGGKYPFERAGYYFIGWSTDPDGNGAYYAPGDTVYNGTGVSMDLYALWTYDYTMTVVYNGNGAISGYTRPTVFPKSTDTVTLSMNGYVHSSMAFGGWFYKQYSTTTVAYSRWKTYGVEPYTVNVDKLIDLVKDTDMPWLVTLYANWQSSASYGVTFRLEKMKVTDGMVNAYSGAEFFVYFGSEPGYNLPKDEEKSNILIYVDSNNDGNFSESELLSGGAYDWDSKTGKLTIHSASIDGRIMIVAGATPGEHTITYLYQIKDNDGKIVQDKSLELKYKYGTYIAIQDIKAMIGQEDGAAAENWAKDGYIFTGWKDDDGRNYQPGDTLMVEGNMEFTGQYEESNIADTVGVFTWNYYRENIPDNNNISTQYNYFVPNGEIQYVSTGTTKETLDNGGQPYFLGSDGEKKTYCFGLMIPKSDTLNYLDNFTVTIQLSSGYSKTVDLSAFCSGTGTKIQDAQDSVKGVQSTSSKTAAKTQHRKNFRTDAVLYKGKLVPDTATEHLMLRPGASLTTYTKWRFDKLVLTRTTSTTEDICEETSLYKDIVSGIRAVFGQYDEDSLNCDHMRRVLVDTSAFPDGYEYFFFSNVNSGNQLLSEVVSITVTQNIGTKAEPEYKSNCFDFYYYDRPYKIRNKGSSSTNEYLPASITSEASTLSSESFANQKKLSIDGVMPMVNVTNGNIPTLSREYANYFQESGEAFTVGINENGYECSSVLLKNASGKVVVTNDRLFEKKAIESGSLYSGSIYKSVYQFSKTALSELAVGNYTIEFYFVTQNGKIPLKDPVTCDLNVYSGTGYRYILLCINDLQSNLPYGDGDNANARYVQLSGITFAADENAVSTYKFADTARIYDLQTGTERGYKVEFDDTLKKAALSEIESWFGITNGLSKYYKGVQPADVTYEGASPGEDAYLLIDNNSSTKFCERYFGSGDEVSAKAAWEHLTEGGFANLIQNLATNEPKFKEGMYNYLLIDVGEGYQYSPGLYPYISYTTASDASVFVNKTEAWGGAAGTITLRSPTGLKFYGSNDATVLTSIDNAKNTGLWTDLTGKTADGNDRLNIEYEETEVQTRLYQLIKLNKRFIGPFGNTQTLEYTLTYMDGSKEFLKKSDVYGDMVITYDVPKGGYFYGWTLTEGSNQVDYLPGDYIHLKQNTTLYAVYGDTAPTWTLIYNSNLPTTTTVTNMPKTQYGYGENKEIVPLVPETAGKTFLGWKRKYALNRAEIEELQKLRGTLTAAKVSDTAKTAEIQTQIDNVNHMLEGYLVDEDNYAKILSILNGYTPASMGTLVDRVNVNVTAKQKELDEANAEYDKGLEGIEKKLKIELDALKAEKEKLEKKLEDLTEEKENLDNEITRLKTNGENLDKTLKELEETASTLEKDLQKLEEDKASKTKTYNDNVGKIGELEEQIQNNENFIKSYTNELEKEAILDKNKGINQKIKETRDDIKEYEGKLEGARTDYFKNLYRNKINELKSELAELEKTQKSYNDEITRLNGLNAECREDITKRTGENETLSKEIKTLESQIASKKQEIEKNKQDQVSTNTKITENKNTLEARKVDLEKTEKDIDTTDKELAEMPGKIKAQEDRIQNAQNELDTLRDVTIPRLEKELEEEKAKIANDLVYIQDASTTDAEKSKRITNLNKLLGERFKNNSLYYALDTATNKRVNTTIDLDQNIILYAQWSDNSASSGRVVYVEDYDNEAILLTTSAAEADYKIELDGGSMITATTNRLTYQMSGSQLTATVVISKPSRVLASISYYVNGAETILWPKNEEDPAHTDGRYTFSVDIPTGETKVRIKVRFADEIRVTYYPNHFEDSPEQLISGETLKTETMTISAFKSKKINVEPADTVGGSKVYWYTQPVQSEGSTNYMTFVGWNTKPDGTGLNAAEAKAQYDGNGELALYAQWRWKVTYDLSIPSGYVLDQEDKTTMDQINSACTENPVVYSDDVKAVLYSDGKLYKTGSEYYTYAKNNSAPGYVLLELVVKKSATEKQMLLGWYNTNNELDEMNTISENTTFHAGYQTAYKITFRIADSEKSKGSMDGKTTEKWILDGSYFGFLPVPNSYDQDRYRFVGWVPVANNKLLIGEENWVDDDGTVIVDVYDYETMGTDFVAKWDDYYKITYYINGVATHQFLKDGEKLVSPDLPKTTSDYKFLGWQEGSWTFDKTINSKYSGIPQYTAVKNETAKTKCEFTEKRDLTLYAKWTATKEFYTLATSKPNGDKYLIATSNGATGSTLALRYDATAAEITATEFKALTAYVGGVKKTYLAVDQDGAVWNGFGDNNTDNPGIYLNYDSEKDNSPVISSEWVSGLWVKWHLESNRVYRNLAKFGEDDRYYIYYNANVGKWLVSKNKEKNVFVYQPEKMTVYTNSPIA